MIKGLCKLTGGRKSRAGLRMILTRGREEKEEEEEEELLLRYEEQRTSSI